MSQMSFPAMPQSRSYELKELRARHQEVIRLSLLGLSNKDIAGQLGVSEQMVCYTVNSELAKEKMGQLQISADTDAVDIAAEIKKIAPQAIDLLGDVVQGLRDAPISLQVKVAQDVLDRNGNGKIQRVQGNVAHSYYGKVGIEQIKERATELGIGTGNVVEVPAEDITNDEDAS
jgi:FixJ family two-component response regulator